MIKEVGSYLEHSQRVLEEMKLHTQKQRGSERTYKSFNDILAELRYRRKFVLGTGASLSELVWTDGSLDQERMDILIDHLSQSTICFWDNHFDAAEEFVRLFYRLSITAIADPNLDSECLDDIIRLCTLLTHDLDLFETVMKTFLPIESFPLLYKLTEDFPGFLSGMFEDAVFKAIACFSSPRPRRIRRSHLRYPSGSGLQDPVR